MQTTKQPQVGRQYEEKTECDSKGEIHLPVQRTCLLKWAILPPRCNEQQQAYCSTVENEGFDRLQVEQRRVANKDGNTPQQKSDKILTAAAQIDVDGYLPWQQGAEQSQGRKGPGRQLVEAEHIVKTSGENITCQGGSQPKQQYSNKIIDERALRWRRR